MNQKAQHPSSEVQVRVNGRPYTLRRFRHHTDGDSERASAVSVEETRLEKRPREVPAVTDLPKWEDG